MPVGRTHWWAELEQPTQAATALATVPSLHQLGDRRAPVGGRLAAYPTRHA